MSNTLEDFGIYFQTKKPGTDTRTITIRRELYMRTYQGRRGRVEHFLDERGEKIEIGVAGETAIRLKDELNQQQLKLNRVFPNRCLPSVINLNYRSIPFLVREIEKHDSQTLETPEGKALKKLAKIVTENLNNPPGNPIADLYDTDSDDLLDGL